MTTTNVRIQTTKHITQDTKTTIQKTKPIIQTEKIAIPSGTTCYKCIDIAMRREIDNKGNKTGRYLCLSCYGQFLCIRNR